MILATNSIYNSSLWDLVKPQSLLAWQRVRTANQLSDSGPDWYNIVSKHNSGTYNNQYMIIDGKKFSPKNALQKDTLFVVEQIPGHVAGSDVTRTLEMGYWPSFNVPYHQDIYIESGYGNVDEKKGQFLFSEYQLAPRAEIFRREEGGVKDLASMQAVMRYNEFQTDPYSEGSPWGAICARGMTFLLFCCVLSLLLPLHYLSLYFVRCMYRYEPSFVCLLILGKLFDA